MVDGNNISWRVTETAVPMEVSNQFHQLNDESFRGTDWSPQKLTKRLVETGRSCRVHDSTVAGGFRRDAPTPEMGMFYSPRYRTESGL